MATKAKKRKKKVSRFTDEQKRIIRVVFGFVFLALCIFSFASLISYAFSWKIDQSIMHNPEAWSTGVGIENICGKVGHLWADFLISKMFGLGAFFVPFFIATISIYCFKIKEVRLLRTFILSLFGCIIFSLFFAYLTGFFPKFFSQLFANTAGGSYGHFVILWSESMLGKLGTGAVILLVLFIWLTFCTKKVALWCDNLVFKAFHSEKKSIESIDNEVDEDDYECKDEQEEESVIGKEESYELEEDDDFEKDEIFSIADIVQDNRKEDSSSDNEISEQEQQNNFSEDDVVLTIEYDDNDYLANLSEEEKARIFDPRLDLSRFKFPPLDLLEDYRSLWREATNEELEANKATIVKALANFKIKVDRIVGKSGPTVTLYKIYLDLSEGGTRIAQVKRLEDDIAMYLGTTGVRVFALPGAIGIEVANEHPSVVPLKMVLNSPQFIEAREKMDLPIAFGITVTNEPFFLDLAKMPHLLIAGATGTGKSVGLNTLITSLLYTKHPSELKFVMVDPKKVELDFYQKLEKHYLAVLPGAEESIITDTRKVINTLKSLCIEMEQRYDLLRAARVRKLSEYNEKFLNRQLNPTKGHQYLPFIVVIIDEFADLLIMAGREIEEPIARLAQKARAVGIHLVFATQRPSANVITGTIKSNFNARIAFKVMSSVDSKVILDQTGANRLIGKGDMLLYTGATDLVRVQCALIETKEVDRITDYIERQQGYSQPYLLPEYEDEKSEDVPGAVDLHKRDRYFDEAARIIVQAQLGSTSLLQRKLSIGYAKAGRIMDQLEVAQIVGPSNGSKARNVLVSDLDALEQILRSLDHI